MPTVDQVFTQLGLWKWYDAAPTNRFNGSSEKGEDFSNLFGTRIGAVAPGKVLAVIHNPNAINDIVIVQGGSGTWLYQHITASVKQGDTIQTGTVVGTQNGLPVDQYSTGTHIEVRYLPAGMWNPNLDQWNQNWVNPAGTFAGIGSKDAGAVTPGGSTATLSSGPSIGVGPVQIQLLPDNWQQTISTAGIKIGLFLLALVLVGFGLYLLFQKQANELAGKVIGTAGKAAVLA